MSRSRLSFPFLSFPLTLKYRYRVLVWTCTVKVQDHGQSITNLLDVPFDITNHLEVPFAGYTVEDRKVESAGIEGIEGNDCAVIEGVAGSR